MKIEVTVNTGDRHIVDVKRWSFWSLSRVGDCCPSEKTDPSTLAFLHKLCLLDKGQGDPFLVRTDEVPTGFRRTFSRSFAVQYVLCHDAKGRRRKP